VVEWITWEGYHTPWEEKDAEILYAASDLGRNSRPCHAGEGEDGRGGSRGGNRPVGSEPDVVVGGDTAPSRTEKDAMARRQYMSCSCGSTHPPWPGSRFAIEERGEGLGTSSRKHRTRKKKGGKIEEACDWVLCHRFD
jgi:hypothetical protein